MKLIKSQTMKLRSLQSIHDFCLAGDYIVIFECPMMFSFLRFVFQSALKSIKYDEDYPTIVHIFRKSDLFHVKSIEYESFYTFHFANGYSEGNKIKIQYCRLNS